MSDELPILYVIEPCFAVTGAFVAARNTARLLKDSVRIVLVLPEGNRIPPAQLSDFWRIDHIPMAPLSKKLSGLVRYFSTLVAGAWQVKKSMLRDRTQRVQLNDFYLMHGVLLRLFGFRGRIISWVRCHPARYAGPLAMPMLWLSRLSADRVVTVSNAIRDVLPKNSEVAVLYDGYEGRTRTPRSWQAEDKKRLIYVGNYIEGKGQDMAIDAFARIAPVDATLRLDFYGGDMGLAKNTMYRARLDALIVQHGLAERMQLHDFTTDTFALMETAYAALNFSQSESFSMTVLEASGAGVPVIATRSGGPQEIIVEGVTGRLIPVGDGAAAAASMLQLAQDTIAAKAMGDAGAAHVRAQFSMQRLREQLLELWQL